MNEDYNFDVDNDFLNLVLETRKNLVVNYSVFDPEINRVVKLRVADI